MLCQSEIINSSSNVVILKGHKIDFLKVVFAALRKFENTFLSNQQCCLYMDKQDQNDTNLMHLLSCLMIPRDDFMRNYMFVVQDHRK